jgi:hypothetical protein
MRFIKTGSFGYSDWYCDAADSAFARRVEEQGRAARARVHGVRACICRPARAPDACGAVQGRAGVTRCAAWAVPWVAGVISASRVRLRTTAADR